VAERRGPRRIQLRRTTGWRLPDGAVVVARPTKWGNPYRIGDPGIDDRATAVARFATLLAGRGDAADRPYPSDAEIRTELAGKDLACWCPLDQPCHAQVLLELANDGPDRRLTSPPE